MTVLARRSALLLVFALACLAVLLAVSTHQASASSYHTCSLSSADKKPNKHGPSYLKRLRVKGGPSCAGAKNLVKLYYKCRTAGSKGDDGACHKKVSGYSCHETRSNAIPTEFDAAVTCRKGSRRVFHRYTQLVD